MRTVGGITAVLLGGCHSVFSIDHVTLSDAGPAGDAAATDARICSGAEPFGPKEPVSIDGDYSVEAARFDADLSTAYLALCPADGNKDLCELYQSQLLLGQFTNHAVLPGISTDGTYDSYPTLTPDGRYMIFSSRRSTDVLQLWAAEKVNGSFGNPVITSLSLVPNTFSNEPYLANATTLYFAATPSNSTNWDLYRATGGPPAFGDAAQVVDGGARSSSNDHAPVVRSDELELFFSSDRHMPGTSGALDIYVARRASTGDTFGVAERLTSLSQSAGNDWPVWLSPDGCALYVINKVGATATLYVARR